MVFWMLQLALAGGTVIAEHLEIALFWRLLKKAPNHATARFPHVQQVCFHTKPRCELSASKHPRACSHLTSATTVTAIKGNQFIDCRLRKQQTVFTDPCPSHSLHRLLPPHCRFLPPGTAQLDKQMQLLITTTGQDNHCSNQLLAVFTYLPFGGDGIYQWPVPAPTSPLCWSPTTGTSPSVLQLQLAK